MKLKKIIIIKKDPKKKRPKSTQLNLPSPRPRSLNQDFPIKSKLKKKTDAQFLISQIIKDEIQKNNSIKKSPKEKKNIKPNSKSTQCQRNKSRKKILNQKK